MDFISKEGQRIKDLLLGNREEFDNKLLQEAGNVRDKIVEIQRIGNVNLLENAHRLVLFIVEGKEQEVKEFADQEGIAWAKHNMTLAFKLEWVHAIRRTLWFFLSEYDKVNEKITSARHFFEMEKIINDLIDQFLNSFFISYSNYKDALIESQRKLVHNLSVPIIPISSSVSILPLIGKIDSFRANIIEEKVLSEIGNMRVQTLIMDLSGIAETDMEAIHHFLKLLDGISMMGCRPVITGFRPEIVRDVVNLDIEFAKQVETKGSLQQVLKQYLLLDNGE